MSRILLMIYVPDPEIKLRIEKAAKAEGRSMSNFLIWLFEQFDKKRCLKKDGHAEGFDNGKANAHLIASAPAMYEALKDLFETYVEECDYCEGTGQHPGDPKSACDECGGVGRIVRGSFAAELGIIEEIIKKARGES